MKESRERRVEREKGRGRDESSVQREGSQSRGKSLLCLSRTRLNPVAFLPSPAHNQLALLVSLALKQRRFPPLARSPTTSSLCSSRLFLKRSSRLFLKHRRFPPLPLPHLRSLSPLLMRLCLYISYPPNVSTAYGMFPTKEAPTPLKRAGTVKTTASFIWSRVLMVSRGNMERMERPRATPDETRKRRFVLRVVVKVWRGERGAERGD